MNTIHEILLNRKRLWNWANATIKNDNWQEFVSFAKAHVLDTRTMNADSQKGVIALCEAFEELTQPADASSAAVESFPVLDHSLERKPQTNSPLTKE